MYASGTLCIPSTVRSAVRRAAVQRVPENAARVLPHVAPPPGPENRARAVRKQPVVLLHTRALAAGAATRQPAANGWYDVHQRDTRCLLHCVASSETSWPAQVAPLRSRTSYPAAARSRDRQSTWRCMRRAQRGAARGKLLARLVCRPYAAELLREPAVTASAGAAHWPKAEVGAATAATPRGESAFGGIASVLLSVKLTAAVPQHGARMYYDTPRSRTHFSSVCRLAAETTVRPPEAAAWA